jgi:hypothetical protein
LLNVRSDSALIAKAESTSIASYDRAEKVCRCVGWAHHSMTVDRLPSSVGSQLGGADIKALKLSVENMERCLEDLIIRMIYLMTCRKGLSIYPLLLFVVMINKEQS